jgi:hypothetical protein
MTPPDTAIASGPTGATRDGSPRFDFSSTEPGSTFECSLDAGAFAPCRTGARLDALTEGGHSFAVRGIDEAGNRDPSPATRAFSVDTEVSDAQVSAPRKLRYSKGKLTIPVTVGAGEVVTASATGTIALGRKKIRLSPSTIDLQSRAKGTLRPAAGRRGTRSVKRLLASGRKAKVKLTITFTDAIGNTETRSVRLKITAKR